MLGPTERKPTLRRIMSVARTQLHRLVEDSITVGSRRFRGVTRTGSRTSSIGWSTDGVLKIEHERNSRKLRSLAEEIEVVEYLNSRGCVSCPRLLEKGTLSSGEPFAVFERLKTRGKPRTADMLLSLLEQKNLGVYQGDFKPSNMVFDGSICYLVDYDQAQTSSSFAGMGNVEFLDWIAADFQARRNQDFYTQKDRRFIRDDFVGCFRNDAFDMSLTTVLANQVTTNTKSGIYHRISYPQIFTDGARDITHRVPVLKRIGVKEGESILDVGCNLGLVSHYFCNRGCSVTGIDMDPNVIRAAKIISNIIGKNITYEVCDMSTVNLDQKFDTVCLFSVFHHIRDIPHASSYISSHARRVILESRLRESGSVPEKRGWKRTNTWKFDSVSEMARYIESLLCGFHLEKEWGTVDRNRHILTFLQTQS